MSESPRTIGRYQLRGTLGSGAMGTVYRAHDPQLRRDVAIKLVHSGIGSVLDSQRFQREALTWAQVVHPAVVQLLDSGLTELKSGTQASYLVLELIEGETVQEHVEREGPLSQRRALKIVTSLAEGLATAHAAGVLHRDLKPSNILLAGDVAKITDFGLAKLYQNRGDQGASLTAAGDVVGTPAYMSPEQVRDERLGPASDVYGLGAVLYFMLSGRPPHTVKVLAALFDQIMNLDPPPLAQLNAEISPELNEVVERCLAKDPTRRYPTAKALAVALSNVGFVQPAAPAGVSSSGSLSWGAGGMIVGLVLGIAVTLGVKLSASAVDMSRDVRVLALEDRLLDDDWDGAIESARALLVLAPEDPELHCYLGQALYSKDDYAAAAEAFEAGLALDPAHPRCLEFLILTYLADETYAQAELAAKRALEQYPEWGSLHRRLAQAQGELQGPSAELEGIERALELNPRDWLAYRQRALVHLEEKDEASAKQDTLAALEIVGDDEAMLYDNLVVVARRQKDYERAIKLSNLAQGAAFRDAGIESLMIRRIAILLDVPDNRGVQMAMQEIEFLLTAFPENGSVHAQQAAIFIRLGQLPEAEAAYRRALELYEGKNLKEAEIVRQNLAAVRDVLEKRRKAQ